MKVLLVEDEIDLSDEIKLFLERHNDSIISVTTGELG